LSSSGRLPPPLLMISTVKKRDDFYLKYEANKA
jgi:hypothetical protein